MNDAMRMRGGQAFGKLRAERKNVFFGERALDESVAQGDAGDIFHHQEIPTIMTIEVEDGGNIRMVESGKSAGFIAKAFAGMLIGESAGVKKLDGDFAIQMSVVGAINDTHTPAAEFVKDTVVFELEPDWIVPDRHLTWHGENSFPAFVRQRLVRGSKVSQYYGLPTGRAARQKSVPQLLLYRFRANNMRVSVSFAEEEKLPAVAPDNIRVLAVLILETGLRSGKEALALKWTDIDFAQREIRVGESKTVAGIRKGPMSNRCKAELLRWRNLLGPEFSEYVFAPSGLRYTSKMYAGKEAERNGKDENEENDNANNNGDDNDNGGGCGQRWPWR